MYSQDNLPSPEEGKENTVSFNIIEDGNSGLCLEQDRSPQALEACVKS